MFNGVFKENFLIKKADKSMKLLIIATTNNRKLSKDFKIINEYMLK